MKLTVLTFLAICIAFCQNAQAQDKLLLRTGDELLVKVLEISPDSIFFTQATDTAKAKLQALPKTSVFSVTYQGGSKELMPEPATPVPAMPSETFLYAMGRADARNNYKAGGVFWATFATSAALPIGGPLLGIPVGAVGTLLNVPEKAMIASKPEYKQSPGYLHGYQKQAKMKKLGNAAAGVGAGTAFALGVVIALFSLSQGY